MARGIILNDHRVPTRLKLSALWASTLFCYIYCDYFWLFVPGELLKINEGTGPFGTATPAILIGVSALMAVPSLMIALSLLLPLAASRWSNLVLGAVYTAVVLLSMPGSPPFYIFFSVIEIALTLTIIWIAVTWPRGSTLPLVGRPDRSSPDGRSDAGGPGPTDRAFGLL